jgi:hypothetical protein
MAMSNDEGEKSSATELEMLALGGLAAAAAAYVSPNVDAATNAALAAGATMGPPGMLRLVKSIFGRNRERWRNYFKAYTEDDPSVDPADAERLFAEAADNPDLRELVVDAARVIAEALSNAVVPAMARLTRLYASTDTKADGFFRGMRRVLTDVTDQDFCDLRAIVGAAAADLPELVPWIQLEIMHGPGPVDDVASLMRSASFPASGQMNLSGETCVLRPAPAGASRLFQLLEINRLAVPGMQRLGLTLPASILIQVDRLQRIKTIVA